jgi:glutamine synthetase adenylyltransferase
VPAEVAEELTELYRAHREVEHRLQMVNDAQTHTMPATAEGWPASLPSAGKARRSSARAFSTG